jgi:hypothetical protein
MRICSSVVALALERRISSTRATRGSLATLEAAGLREKFGINEVTAAPSKSRVMKRFTVYTTAQASVLFREGLFAMALPIFRVYRIEPRPEILYQKPDTETLPFRRTETTPIDATRGACTRIRR